MATLTGTTMTAEALFEKLQQTGVAKTEAQLVVADWILGNAGLLPKRFAFRTPFAESEADCAPQFARSFAHQDWVDGEDVVQAEQTTGEEGFNVRFHRIEADLDQLGRDVGQAFVCVNAMRASLRRLLDELQAEINLIYMQIARGGKGGGIGPVLDPRPFVGGRYVGTTKYFDKDVHIFETDAGRVVLPAVEGVKITPFENPRVLRTLAFAEFTTRPDVQALFAPGGAVSKTAFVERFGHERLSNGETVREALEIVPVATRFVSAQAVVDGLATREGAAIKTSGLERDAIEDTFGIRGDKRVADAPIDRLELVPSDARAALTREGVTTIGGFAERDPAQLAELLQRAGVDAKTDDVAGWIGAGKALVNAS